MISLLMCCVFTARSDVRKTRRVRLGCMWAWESKSVEREHVHVLSRKEVRSCVAFSLLSLLRFARINLTERSPSFLVDVPSHCVTPTEHHLFSVCAVLILL